MANTRVDTTNYTAEQKQRILFFLNLQAEAKQQIEAERKTELAEQKRQTQNAAKYGNGTI